MLAGVLVAAVILGGTFIATILLGGLYWVWWLVWRNLED